MVVTFTGITRDRYYRSFFYEPVYEYMDVGTGGRGGQPTPPPFALGPGPRSGKLSVHTQSVFSGIVFVLINPVCLFHAIRNHSMLFPITLSRFPFLPKTQQQPHMPPSHPF